ncbi:MAG TPA: hypothetical protein VM536_04755 [Chloroflexia bacterium]|nr:hypothetical protein [Chloroflexia bacterium]
MARFVGKEQDAGGEFIARLLAFLLVVVLLMVLLALFYPPFGHYLLTVLNMPDNGAPGIGR